MRFSLPHRIALAGVVLGAVVLSGTPPALGAATGSITGRVTTSTGAGATDVWVEVHDSESWGTIGWTSTGADGSYTVGDLPTGSYLVAFKPSDGPQQYHDRKSQIWDADVVTVTDGAATTVDEQLFATGAISGQIRNPDGTPRADLLVTAREAETGDTNWANTDGEGRFRIPVLAGSYRVFFEPIEGSYQTQHVPQKIAETDAALFTVIAGAEVTADDTILPTGSLSGRLTTAAGDPLVATEVYISTSDGQSVGVWPTTDDNGEFTVPALLTGSYRISLWHNGWVQYYRGKRTHAEADPVTITAGDDTHIDESLLGTGSVRLSAVDAVTGAPVPDFCADGECSEGTGAVTIGDLPQGRHEFDVYTEGKTHMPARTGPVDVVTDQTVELTIRLRPAARITTTVVDRATGAPVAGVCVSALPVHGPRLPDGYGDCTDSTGRMIIGPLEGGSYQLFAHPRRSGHGQQWVGQSGGTGDQRSAVLVKVSAGETVAGPQVRLDPAGRITGRVTDATTGAPLEYAQVSLLSFHPGTGPASDVVTDADGRYEITGMGPYEWPVLFVWGEYAWQWSGGTGDRYTATRVPVTTTGTATYNHAMVTGTEVTGGFENQRGEPFDDGYVLAKNARTGDIMGAIWITDGAYRMRVLGGQFIYFGYDASFQGTYYHSDRYVPPTLAPTAGSTGPGPRSIVASKPRSGVYRVPTGGALQVDIVVPTA